jgi:UDP-GlcNAc:undecaprenyl-phosphate/decaprenyl-phosphate GlcNAc-1-phosphate transferase
VSKDALDALPLILLALVASAVVSFVLTPFVIRLAPRLSAIDVPDDERRVHERPIPRTGGIAVALAFVGVGLAGVLANAIFEFVPLRAVRVPELGGLFVGVSVGALIGYLDDRLQLRARWQFVGQFALAAIALAAGITIDRLPNPLGDQAIVLNSLGDVAIMAATALWFVGMLNSVNFIDGLDGLLTGVATIAVVALGINSLLAPVQPLVAALCALLAGSLLGFLPYNFHPARVFIGTAGVFAVGYALAALSVLGTAKVALALLVLGVPIIDAFWIIIRRVSSGRSPFSADRGHFHHRLLDLGLSHRQAVLLIYLIGILLAVGGFVLSGRGQISFFLTVVIGGGVALFLLTRRASGGLERSSYPADGDEERGERA